MSLLPWSRRKPAADTTDALPRALVEAATLPTLHHHGALPAAHGFCFALFKRDDLHALAPVATLHVFGDGIHAAGVVDAVCRVLDDELARRSGGRS